MDVRSEIKIKCEMLLFWVFSYCLNRRRLLVNLSVLCFCVSVGIYMLYCPNSMSNECISGMCQDGEQQVVEETDSSCVETMGFGFSGSGWTELPDLKDSLFIVSNQSRPTNDEEKSQRALYITCLPSKSMYKVITNEWTQFYINRSNELFINNNEDELIKIGLLFSISDNGDATVTLKMINDDGSEVVAPSSRKSFILKSSSSVHYQSSLDKNILASSGAVWCGRDILLSKDDDRKNKERILFLKDDSTIYSVYLSSGETIVLGEYGTWRVSSDSLSERNIVLVLKNIYDDKLEFDGWGAGDVSSKNIVLNKEHSCSGFIDISTMKIYSVRSSVKALLMFGSKRFFVSVGSWVVLDDSNEVIHVTEDISVAQKCVNSLLYIDNMFQQRGKWYMDVDLYNKYHSDKIRLLMSEYKTEKTD